MNENRCPKCDLLNLPSAARCLKCGAPLLQPSTTFSEQKTEDFPHKQENYAGAKTADFPNASGSFGGTAPPSFSNASAADFPPPTPLHTNVLPASKTGSRAYFWYRMLCSAVVVSSVLWAVFGLLAVAGSFNETGKEAADAFTGGMIMFASGAAPALLFLLGVVFPARPWSWFFGLLLLVLALLSCVFAPFSVALIFFWIKPATMEFFGRG